MRMVHAQMGDSPVFSGSVFRWERLLGQHDLEVDRGQLRGGGADGLQERLPVKKGWIQFAGIIRRNLGLAG